MTLATNAGPTENWYGYNASEIQRLKSVPDSSELYFILPALLASFLGVEGLRIANADADKVCVYWF